MKREGHLYERLTCWPNLVQAVCKAARGKRFRDNVALFLFDAERELLRLQRQLCRQTYKPGPYRTFTIYEPKRRLISAAPFRDRVVHHAVCNVIEPIFERRFIFDSYACRKGKGTHAAVRRAQGFARRFCYVLKADARKFFPSMDHAILKRLLARKIKDPQILWLLDRIIDSSNAQQPVYELFRGDSLFTPLERRKGLPIGNQTSQFFANVYLDPLDHLARDRLRLPAYLRYCDDFLAFSDDKRLLAESLRTLDDFLHTLRLRLHRDKSVIFQVKQGIPFLGYRVFPTHLRLAKQNIKRFRRRMRRLQALYAADQISAEDLRQRIVSWIGHAGQADSFHLRERLLAEFPFRKGATLC